jgi:hypothetical protein
MTGETNDLLKDAKGIPLCEWQRRIQTYPCRTISGRYFPVRDPIAYEYVCSASTLVSLPALFLAKFISRDGKRIVEYNDAEATPITVADFAKNSAFVNHLLREWDTNRRPFSARLLIQICSACGRRVVIDGIHRLIHIVNRGILDADLYVTELSGPEWPPDMPDMKVICNCKSGQEERRKMSDTIEPDS